MTIKLEKNEVKAIKKEVISSVNGGYYCILSIYLLLFVLYIYSCIRDKKITFGVLLLIIPIIANLNTIINKKKEIDLLFKLYLEYDPIEFNIEINNNSLIINNISRNEIVTIEDYSIKKVVYTNHSTIVYTKDKKIYVIPKRIIINNLCTKKYE